MSDYAIKMPDMSRNMALAGKTVSSMGRNITYDQDGYAVKAVNCNSKLFAGTSKGVYAPSRDAVLANGNRAYDGLAQDLDYFSNEQLSIATKVRAQASSGEISESTANEIINGMRALYGYTGGQNGWTFARLSYPAQQESYSAQSVYAQGGESGTARRKGPKPALEETVRGSAVQQESAAQPDRASQQSEAQQLREQVRHTQDTVRELQSELGLPVSEAALSREESIAAQNEDPDQMRILRKEVQRLQEDVQQLQYSFQTQLARQQQQQSLQSGLQDMQRQDALLQMSEKKGVSDALLDILAEEEEKQ